VNIHQKTKKWDHHLWEEFRPEEVLWEAGVLKRLATQGSQSFILDLMKCLTILLLVIANIEINDVRCFSV
jgi:hypothetical protein